MEQLRWTLDGQVGALGPGRSPATAILVEAFRTHSSRSAAAPAKASRRPRHYVADAVITSASFAAESGHEIGRHQVAGRRAPIRARSSGPLPASRKPRQVHRQSRCRILTGRDMNCDTSPRRVEMSEIPGHVLEDLRRGTWKEENWRPRTVRPASPSSMNTAYIDPPDIPPSSAIEPALTRMGYSAKFRCRPFPPLPGKRRSPQSRMR